MDSTNVLRGINLMVKSDSCYKILYVSGESAQVHIMNSHVFRYYMSPNGVFLDYPIPRDDSDNARITYKSMNQYGTSAFQQSTLLEDNTCFKINTAKIEIIFDKDSAMVQVYDKRTNKVAFHEVKPLTYANCQQTQTLQQSDNEFYYGCGMQNGRFSHKGNLVMIENTNNWVDGGVTSPCPFFWSTYGYGVLRNTWTDGVYDFGNGMNTTNISITHKGNNPDFDAFYFINALPKDILNDYYELTGKPILLPEYAFYEAHLNAFNRDIWVKVDSSTSGAILFEDGFYYKSYPPSSGKVGILESLNGEKNNYQFSARAVIDRYNKYDMPLGWFIPNDGYGCGYGQTDSLDGDIQNLLQFTEYAKGKGVEVALWTESQLTPADPSHPKKGERDLGKEVNVAGVVGLKCDVAWIGYGYSFALNAVENSAKIFKENSNRNQRLFIIMVDGWAGTQRYAGIWSGDQIGGQWEYIRFHIPTYIGTGLSGQPVFGSDMDGIYGGGDKYVNIRDFQWKTFTPLQLNMDGWGDVPKYPFSFGDEAADIKRAYLKLKSMLMPYNYTISHESLHGLPMIRAMFLEYPNDIYAHTVATQYQFMWGSSILVAPVYEPIEVRNEIYLPDEEQNWIDLFTGKRYRGGCVLNNFSTPLSKIPVFIRDGAIIPNVESNNNVNEINRSNRTFLIYPNKNSEFEVYEDDGYSSDYLNHLYATTKIIVHGPNLNEGEIYIHVNKTNGHYKEMKKERSTLLQIMTQQPLDSIKTAINGVSLEMSKANTDKEFREHTNVYYFDNDFIFNPYMKHEKQPCLLIKLHKVDITATDIHIKISGSFYTNSPITKSNKKVNIPTDFTILNDKSTHHSMMVQWTPTDAEFYEIERDGIIFTNLTGNHHLFRYLKNGTEYCFRIRSVLSSTALTSEWSQLIQGKTLSAIKVANVKCSVPCEGNQDVVNLLNNNEALWHTDWRMPNQASLEEHKTITVDFDLGKTYTVNRVDYIPREDGGNGTFSKIKYKYSTDGDKWSESSIINLDVNGLTKKIHLNGVEFRYFKLIILESVRGFGSGREILFYKI